MAGVDFVDVRKSFGAFPVIKGVDIEIEDGEFVILVGPSGCGKSTLLRMLAGLENITAGEIRIGDRVVNTLPPKERDIAMVFQNYALYPHMTVAANMAFSLMLAGSQKSEIDSRVARAADILGLSKLLDRYPRQLSGGQRQRVAMGRAIVRDPQVFLFDEPLSNLDAKLRVAMRSEIKELHQRLKTTTVYVTHDQIEAMTMATKIAVMDGGVIQQFGSPDEIYSKPQNLFVAGFIGAPAMNLRPATVTLNGAGPKAEIAGAAIDLSRYPFETAPTEGQQIVVGLRPEHFGAPGEALGDGVASFELPVQYTEKTGGDATGYLNTDAGLMAVRIDPERIGALKQGDRVQVGFPAGKLHVFDARTGRRL